MSHRALLKSKYILIENTLPSYPDIEFKKYF